jgi:hypothetical protein
MPAPNPARSKLARDALARWGADPVAFSRDVLGFVPWERDPAATHGRDGQGDVLRALTRDLWLAVRSGHKCGKSSLAACAALWFVVTKPRARVVMTAPSAHQIQNIVWKEVRDRYREARIPIGGELFSTAHVGLKFSDGREVIGLSTDEPERFAGISAPNMLFIVDEASGLDERIFEAIFGNSAGGATVLLLSNPTRTSGTFFEAFHSRRDNWRTFHISSLDTPPMRGEPCPGLATPEWLAKARAQWGEGSPYFDVRVRGEFPKQGENAVVPMALVEAARARYAPHPVAAGDLGNLALGVDVARFGDDETAIAPVRGSHAYPLIVRAGADGPATAASVVGATLEHRTPGETPLVNVDVIGVGASVYDSLAHAEGIVAAGVNVAERADEPELYANLRAQLWYRLRNWLRDGGALPPDDKLAAELVAPTFRYDAKGRLQVEAKDAIKARLRRSPDRADALALAIHRAAPLPSLASLERYRAGLPRSRW